MLNSIGSKCMWNYAQWIRPSRKYNWLSLVVWLQNEQNVLYESLNFAAIITNSKGSIYGWHNWAFHIQIWDMIIGDMFGYHGGLSTSCFNVMRHHYLMKSTRANGWSVQMQLAMSYGLLLYEVRKEYRHIGHPLPSGRLFIHSVRQAWSSIQLVVQVDSKQPCFYLAKHAKPW